MARNLRISPQKLNLVAAMIRGKKVQTALTELEFSRKRIAVDVRKCLMSAVANAENNHGLDVDDLVVSEAWVGKNLVMKRFHARGRGRSSSDHEAVLANHRRRARGGCGKHRRPRRAQRRPTDGPQSQSGRPSRRHQPHLGQPLVRRRAASTAGCCTKTWRSATTS